MRKKFNTFAAKFKKAFSEAVSMSWEAPPFRRPPSMSTKPFRKGLAAPSGRAGPATDGKKGYVAHRGGGRTA